MESHITSRYRDLYKKLPTDIRKQARDAYRLWQQDPFHPSLQFKRLGASIPAAYSVRIGLNYRAIGRRIKDDVIVWVWIGSHAEYDKLIKGL